MAWFHRNGLQAFQEMGSYKKNQFHHSKGVFFPQIFNMGDGVGSRQRPYLGDLHEFREESKLTQNLKA